MAAVETNDVSRVAEAACDASDVLLELTHGPRHVPHRHHDRVRLRHRVALPCLEAEVVEPKVVEARALLEETLAEWAEVLQSADLRKARRLRDLT